jgi:hypothetical protein
MIVRMVRAIREIVTVGPGGSIRVQAPELREGARAEVIVLIDAGPGTPTVTPLDALDALQDSLKLSAAGARDWAERSDAERKASTRS